MYREWIKQAYVSEFLSLKCAGDVLNIVSPLGDKAQKEITESMAVVKRLRSISLRKPMEYTLYDLCAGNALTSVIAVHLLPIKHAVAMDKKPRKRQWRLAKRFQYVTKDIYDIDPKYNIAPNSIIIAVHACTDLSNRVINIYLESDASYLILMPCCEGKKTLYFPPIFKEKLGTYLWWSYQLALKAKGRLLVDEKVISPKNALIIARKKEECICCMQE